MRGDSAVVFEDYSALKSIKTAIVGDGMPKTKLSNFFI